MNELIIPEKMNAAFPSMAQGLERTWKIFQSIASFEDIEQTFLKGAGLSPNTYRSYLTAVRQLYDFTGGLNPLQIAPAHIESFYDDLVKRVDKNTAYLRIRGLKKFFAGIRNVIPFYTSPFEIMSEKLTAKLNKTKKGNRTKKALTKNELKDLLTFLAADTSVMGLENYAICLTLVTTGLRASELCQLNWKALDYSEGKYTAYFTGKGGLDAEQEIPAMAIEATKQYFRAQYHRQPHTDNGDRFFYASETFPGKELSFLKVPTLWRRLKAIDKRARAAGVLTRDLQFSPHLFRRTFASLLFREGMDVKALQGATRHANVETLMKHYVDSSESTSPYWTKILGEVTA